MKQNHLEVDVYRVLADCVEVGVEVGWNHAHKHVDDPDRATIQAAIYDAVMDAVAEKFWFPEPPDGA